MLILPMAIKQLKSCHDFLQPFYYWFTTISSKVFKSLPVTINKPQE